MGGRNCNAEEKAESMTIDEGLCVQIMHTGPFDNEPESVVVMDAFCNGYTKCVSSERYPENFFGHQKRCYFRCFYAENAGTSGSLYAQIEYRSE